MGLVDILDLEYNLILYILILYSITSMGVRVFGRYCISY